MRNQKEEENEVKVVKMEQVGFTRGNLQHTQRSQASDHHMSSRSMEIRQLEVSSLGNSNGPLFQSPRLQLEPSESGPSGHLTPEPSNQQSSDQVRAVFRKSYFRQRLTEPHTDRRYY